MNKNSNEVAAGAIWGSLRSLISEEFRREAALAIITKLPLDDDNIHYCLETRLLLADAGELDDVPQRDECDFCPGQAVWRGVDNEYDGNPLEACNSCVVRIENPTVIE